MADDNDIALRWADSIPPEDRHELAKGMMSLERGEPITIRTLHYLKTAPEPYRERALARLTSMPRRGSRR